MWCPKCLKYVQATVSTTKSPNSTEEKRLTKLVTVKHTCPECHLTLHTTTHKEG